MSLAIQPIRPTAHLDLDGKRKNHPRQRPKPKQPKRPKSPSCEERDGK